MKKLSIGGAVTRKLAKQELLELAMSFGIREGKTKLMAIFSLQTGYTIKRIEEYIEELELAGLIVLQGDTISIPVVKQGKEPDKELV